MAVAGQVIEESFDCGALGAADATRRLLEAVSVDGDYQAVQVGPSQIQFARSFRPTWALAVGICMLPVCLVGVAFFFVTSTEACLATVESDHRGTRVRLSGRLKQTTAAAVRTALSEVPPSPPPPVGAPVGSVAEARSPAVGPTGSPSVARDGGAQGAGVAAPTGVPASGWSPPSVDRTGLIGGVPGSGSDPSPPVPDPLPSPASAPLPAAVSTPEERTVSLAAVRAGRSASFAATVPMVVLDDGRQVPLAALTLVGRDPTPAEGEEAATLVAVPDPDRSVSKTHVALEFDGTAVWLVDRGSTNGTEVVGPDGVRSRVAQRSRHVLAAGDVVHFGERTLRVLGVAAQGEVEG